MFATDRRTNLLEWFVFAVVIVWCVVALVVV
jgi:hypothetical protein